RRSVADLDFENDDLMVAYEDMLMLQSRSKILQCLLSGLQGQDKDMFSLQAFKDKYEGGRRSKFDHRHHPNGESVLHEVNLDGHAELKTDHDDVAVDRYLPDTFYGWKC
ncbi:unnamed protein product, partial [Heterosigma akashiwo]